MRSLSSARARARTPRLASPAGRGRPDAPDRREPSSSPAAGPPRGLRRGALAALLAGLALAGGCAGGPSYAGGPTAEEPHGVVTPGRDITIWGVDGYSTVTRSGSIRVLPGLRQLRVRIEHPMESDSATPHEIKDTSLFVHEGARYLLERRPGLYPPYELEITEARPRR